MSIHFEDQLLEEMNTWLKAAYPHEACGFLEGRLDGDTRVVEKIIPARNISSENLRRRFVIDPHDYLRAERSADAAGKVLIGIFHSHPDHPAVPSQHDLANAHPFFSYVIASVENGVVEAVRSYRLTEDTFSEEKVIVTSEQRIP